MRSGRIKLKKKTEEINQKDVNQAALAQSEEQEESGSQNSELLEAEVEGLRNELLRLEEEVKKKEVNANVVQELLEKEYSAEDQLRLENIKLETALSKANRDKGEIERLKKEVELLKTMVSQNRERQLPPIPTLRLQNRFQHELDISRAAPVSRKAKSQRSQSGAAKKFNPQRSDNPGSSLKPKPSASPKVLNELDAAVRAGAAGVGAAGGRAIRRPARQPVARSKIHRIHKGVLFTVSTTILGATIAVLAWYFNRVPRDERKPVVSEHPEKKAQDKVIEPTRESPRENTTLPLQELSASGDAEANSNMAHLDASQGEGRADSSLCEAYTDDRWKTHCHNMKSDEERALIERLWQIKDWLLVARYSPYTLDMKGALVSGELPTKRHRKRKKNNKNLLLLADQLVTVASLTEAELRQYLNSLISIDSFFTVGLVKQLQLLNAYGKICGIMPQNYTYECTQKINQWLKGYTARRISNELSVMPSSSINFSRLSRLQVCTAYFRFGI